MLEAAHGLCQDLAVCILRPIRALARVAEGDEPIYLFLCTVLTAGTIILGWVGWNVLILGLLSMNREWPQAQCEFTAPMSLEQLYVSKGPDVYRVDAPVKVTASDGITWTATAHRWPTSRLGEVHMHEIAEWWSSIGLQAAMTAPPSKNFFGQMCCSAFKFSTPVGTTVPCWFDHSAPEQVKLSNEAVKNLWAQYVVAALIVVVVLVFALGAMWSGYTCCAEDYCEAYADIEGDDEWEREDRKDQLERRRRARAMRALQGVTIQRSRSHLFVDRQDSYSGSHDAALRNGFLRKVWGIVCAQVWVTALIGMAFMYYDPLNEWALYYGRTAALPLLGLTIAVLFGLTCVKNTYPHNYLTLMVFTLLLSVSVGTVLARARYLEMEGLVVQAAALTALLFVGLTAFTLQSRMRFEFLSGPLYAALCALLLAGAWRFAFPASQLGETLYALAGCLIFSLYIILDTYLITERLGYDDYIVAAIELYLDILNLFLSLLRLLAAARS